MYTILPAGGRIKAASVGLNNLRVDGSDLDEKITKLRREPPAELRTAFFPRTGKDLAQAIRGIGFFRPMLKTDQGMGGNFLPFTINTSLTRTDLSVRSIGHEEGCAIPEAWHPEACGYAPAMQKALYSLDLREAYAILEKLGGREADKGRLPFFLIRPALPEHPMIFGMDVLHRVQTEVNIVLNRCIEHAHELERRATGKVRDVNMIYVQPDVFILTDGTVMVEKINCPDVGFFLGGIDAPDSRVFSQLQPIVNSMLGTVVAKILATIGQEITIVTRDEVLCQTQDILEIREIAELEKALRAENARVRVISVSDVDSIPSGTRLLLLNIDYRSASTKTLIQRHAAEEITCYPNPFYQMACLHATGLKESEMGQDHKHRQRFLEWARSEPSSAAGKSDVLRQIDRALKASGIENDIVHSVLNVEMVPILRSSMHAWHQLAARVQRPENRDGAIRFRDVPARPDNLLLTSSTGPRLHAFRFMCVS